MFNFKRKIKELEHAIADYLFDNTELEKKNAELISKIVNLERDLKEAKEELAEERLNIKKILLN